MFNTIIDSWEVRAQKSSHRSKERLKIKMLKETLRQWDDALR
jgi:hypothetical protein